MKQLIRNKVYLSTNTFLIFLCSTHTHTFDQMLCVFEEISCVFEKKILFLFYFIR
jgi:hypothetical protein